MRIIIVSRLRLRSTFFESEHNKPGFFDKMVKVLLPLQLSQQKAGFLNWCSINSNHEFYSDRYEGKISANWLRYFLLIEILLRLVLRLAWLSQSWILIWLFSLRGFALSQVVPSHNHFRTVRTPLANIIMLCASPIQKC